MVAAPVMGLPPRNPLESPPQVHEQLTPMAGDPPAQRQNFARAVGKRSMG